MGNQHYTHGDTYTTSPTPTNMSKLLVFLVFIGNIFFSISYTINVAVKIEEKGHATQTVKGQPGMKSDSIMRMSPNQTSLVEDLFKDLEESYRNLARCDYSKILKCTEKITQAIVRCSNHPDIAHCIEEILEKDSDCMDCVKVICRKLHIEGCM